MASDRLTTPRGGWEKAANASFFWSYLPNVVTFTALRESLGWLFALILGVALAIVLQFLIARRGSRSRSRRLAADAERGVAEAFFRFLDEDNGRTPNHGWREGVLLLCEGGVSFRKLRGPGGPRVGEDIALVDPRVLGQHDLEPPLVPGLTTDMKAFTLSTGGRDIELALHAGYLKHQRFNGLFDVRGRV